MEIEHLISERTLHTARELARRFPSIDMITICRAVEGTRDAESAARFLRTLQGQLDGTQTTV